MDSKITLANFVNLNGSYASSGVLKLGEINYELAKEYAKQVAIDFAEYIQSNSYKKTDKGWYQQHIEVKPLRNYSFSTIIYDFISIEELFEKYLQSKQ